MGTLTSIANAAALPERYSGAYVSHSRTQACMYVDSRKDSCVTVEQVVNALTVGCWRTCCSWHNAWHQLLRAPSPPPTIRNLLT